MKKKPIKALGLVSGGLDSTLATKMLQDLGIETIGINFNTGFCLTDHHRKLRRKKKKIRNEALRAGADLSFPIEIIDISKNYFHEVVLKSKYGYGSGINPCLDCRLYMLKKAKQLMKKFGADFIYTGEVLGQRPMSQLRNSLNLIEKRSDLKGLLLRPLSAKHLLPTIPEKLGWIDREKLGNISGRGRKVQLELAEQWNIVDFPQPAGGCCSLPDKNFAVRLRDYLKHSKRIMKKDLILLKVGRHFRISPEAKLIVGRDEAENKFLENFQSGKWLLTILDVPGPSALLHASKDHIRTSARIVARYCDHEGKNCLRIQIKKGRIEKIIETQPMSPEDIEAYRIT